jgi:hypothetical protein
MHSLAVIVLHRTDVGSILLESKHQRAIHASSRGLEYHRRLPEAAIGELPCMLGLGRTQRLPAGFMSLPVFLVSGDVDEKRLPTPCG